MSLGTIYRKLALSSPRVEILLRKAYWVLMPLLHKWTSDNGAKEPAASGYTALA